MVEARPSTSYEENDAQTDDAKKQRRLKIQNALSKLKTMLTDKQVEVDQNDFKLLLFQRAQLDENKESVEIIP